MNIFQVGPPFTQVTPPSKKELFGSFNLDLDGFDFSLDSPLVEVVYTLSK